VKRLTFANTSLLFLLSALLCLGAADIAVTALHPWGELARLLEGIFAPDASSIEVNSVVWTVAFAVVGVSIGATAGFVLAIAFPRCAGVRVSAVVLRSIHELFWALLLIQVFGIGPAAGVLAIAIPYTGIFAKVFAEFIEEADLSAERVLPAGTSAVSAFAFARLPEVAERFRTYTLYRLECGLRSTLVLGFIGLPTVGFHLEGYFKQGKYAQAAALLAIFYVLLCADRHAPPVGSTRNHALPLHRRRAAAARRDRRRLGARQPRPLPHPRHRRMALLALLLFPLVSHRFMGPVMGPVVGPVMGPVMGPVGQPAGRALLVVVRSTPEYMLAYVLLQVLGPSMLPASIALAVHNGAIVGYLMGRQADALHYRPDAPKGFNLYAYDTAPRLYGQFLAYNLYRWEIIVRQSAIFGILGVTTLGHWIDAAISELKFDVAVVLILVTVFLCAGIEALSRRLRRACASQPSQPALPTRRYEPV
jgi:phosphonate transport system permease protein